MPPPPSVATPSALIKQQNKYPILNGRPASTVGPPITIYEPVFSQFRAMNEGEPPVEISPKDYGFVKTLLTASAAIYSTEKERTSGIDAPMEGLLGRPVCPTVLVDNSSNDGVIQIEIGEKTGLLLVREIKNEVGMGHCDPCVQVAFSYSKWWSDNKVRILCCLYA